jgi:Uncharacterized proteins, LmbE homologs
MVIAAHHDDIEIMCPQGIVKGYKSAVCGLVAVVMTDGAGSPRTGEYASFTDEQMKTVRKEEQKEAARIGDYAALHLLNYTSAEVKDFKFQNPTGDLAGLVSYYKPETVFIHNLADKHKTHKASAFRAVKAIRSIPAGLRPKKLYGCEVWRSLDWLPDSEKIIFDVGGHDELLTRLINVFRSQIGGGKRYDLAAQGRRFANATFGEYNSVDRAREVAFAMDLTPLIQNDEIEPREYVLTLVNKFMNEL